ncbi:MAG: hypothetical protein HQL75_07780 [Magnetococcales bacterium]|nr:hypothetical protein [Magnetococcales bacterium]
MAMKLHTNRRILPLMSVLCLSAWVGGCMGEKSDSSSSSSTPSIPTTTLVGKFLDGPTDGLVYRTSSNDTGSTDAEGQFTYAKGETITFYLGGLPLGSTTARGIITPIDLVPGGHINDDQVVNLARFLQTLDEDGNPDSKTGTSSSSTTATDTTTTATSTAAGAGITISEKAIKAATIHFHNGVDYANFFKTDGHVQGFASSTSPIDDTLATDGLQRFFKDANIFRYKKSNWIEYDTISGFLVPETFAINHLRGTIQKQTESWAVTLTPTVIYPSAPMQISTTTTTTAASTVTKPGTASLTVYYPAATSTTDTATATTTTTTSSSQTTSDFHYYDPNLNPLADGKLTFPGVSIVTQETTTTTATDTTTAATTTTTTAATTTTPTAVTTIKDVTVTGDLTVNFTGATVTMTTKTGSNGKDQGQLNIEILKSSTSNTATFTPDATSTATVSIPTSEITSLAIKATVDLETGTLSESKFSIQFANSTWQKDLNLNSVFGTWSRESDHNIIFNEMYRGLSAKADVRSWELYGIGYTNQEMVAELSGTTGAYSQLSPNRTNLKLISDSSTWNNKNVPIPLNGYIGFQLMIYDPLVRVDQLYYLSDALRAAPVVVTDTPVPTTEDKRYLNLKYQNMTDGLTLSTVLNDTSDNLTWGVSDTTAGPGMISVVFTKNAALTSSSATFETALTEHDRLVMKLVK